MHSSFGQKFRLALSIHGQFDELYRKLEQMLWSTSEAMYRDSVQNAQATYSDVEAEIGEAVDLVVHIHLLD